MKKLQHLISILDKIDDIPESARRRWAGWLIFLIMIPAVGLWIITIRFSVSGFSGSDAVRNVLDDAGGLVAQTARGMANVADALKFFRQTMLNELELDSGKNAESESSHRVRLPIVE